MLSTMSVQASTKLIIFVTHVETDDLYLKIWGQVDKNSATCVERMILPLTEQFARSQGCVGSQAAGLRINALCCARFQNEGYYRAKVINIRSDGMVVLQFIDYGNIEILPPQEIHLLENIPGSESLQSFPPMAFDFTLMHVLPINGAWENKIIDSIKKTLWYNEYNISIQSVVNNHRFVKLWYNNEDFSELLVKRHMAVAATLQDMLRSKCVQQPQAQMYQHPNKRVINNNCTPVTPMVQNIIQAPLQCEGNESHAYGQNILSCCGPQQKYLSQVPPVQEALVFKSRVLDVGSKHDIYVSFVEDGPHKFSVQVQSTSQILTMLMRDINTHPIQSLNEPPLPGSVCLGRYTQDKVLCRAVVMSVMENKCKLYYVDFGHTEVLPYTDIFQLPPHYINPRVLSIRFTLSGVKELNVTDEMKEYFKKVVSGKSLILHVRPPEGPPLVQYGDLYDNGNNIKDILRQAFPTPTTPAITQPVLYQEPRKLSKGKEEIVHVSFIESCTKFFVQLDNSIKSLDSIMAYLAEFCKTAPTLNLAQLKVGYPCAAIYDNQWYRAQVLNINMENIRVLYVDYGNEETVNIMSIRLIHDDLVRKLQAQAIRCILNGWDQLPLTDEVATQFELLILEKRLCMKVIDIRPEGVVVDLYDPVKMESIKSQLAHTINSDKNASDDSNKSIEGQYSPKANVTKGSPRSSRKLQLNLVHPQKNKITRTKEIRENTNKWQKKNVSECWQPTQSSTGGQERNKTKTWKDELNEEKRHDGKVERNNFHYSEPRGERSDRGGFSNNRNTKDRWDSRTENAGNSFNKSPRGGRGGRRGGFGNASSKYNVSNTSDKSWSDKDSDTSSRGSNRRGRGSSNRGGYNKRDGFPGKMQSPKWGDKENNEGSFKSNRPNNDVYQTNKSKERRGPGNRTPYKLNTSSSPDSEMDGTKRRSPIRIPSANIPVGTTEHCEVVFTNSPSDFFIQKSADFAALDTVMENISAIYEDGGELMKTYEIKTGAYCIAQYTEDSKWYRAVIKSVAGDRATVQFVDYGNTENIEFNKIKTIQKEFLDLPTQAVHCKLFGVRDFNNDAPETKLFVDKTAAKTLEAEFVTEEMGVCNVLLREVVDGATTTSCINEEFSEGVDLMKAKEEVIHRKKNTGSKKQFVETDYASMDVKWTVATYEAGTKQNIIVTWFTNPNNFYCQILDKVSEFRAMMNEIQKMYVGREPVSYKLEIGSPVLAIFHDDGALYRAEIVELNKPGGHLVRYIDFGNNAVVELRKIYPVEKKLLHLPKQAVQCSLKNIIPKDGLGWTKTNTGEIDKCFNADKYECTFYEVKENKYLTSLNDNGNDVAENLVKKELALFATDKSDNEINETSTETSIVPYDIQRVDINLLTGQALKVKVSSVQSANKFYIQLPSFAETENIINTYMADKDPKVLALPGELSVMQNQAIECSLENVVSSPEIDKTLKEILHGKDIIMLVDRVDNNRLIVKLFDTSGKKIILSEDVEENISPICPMPILISTHKVSVSYADSPSSIWLQRSSEFDLESTLTAALEEYYPTSGTVIQPKINLICAAKGSDDHWYRAKVINSTVSGAYVNFIDYGNNEEVGFDAIMELNPQFYEPHQLAINVSLPVTLDCAESEGLNILQTNLSNKEFTAVFNNVDQKWVVELIYDGEKISDRFRLLNSEIQEQNINKGDLRIHNTVIGQKYDVYVSHMDSPSQFWLQLVDEATNLSKKQEELQEAVSTFPVINGVLEEGSLCVAAYSIDNLWYRAQVLDADEDITTVRFIDYGNTDVIDNTSGNIRGLTGVWKEVKEYAIKCRLDVVPIDSEDWNEVTCEKCENLVNSAESVQALIIGNGVPKRVDLITNGKSVSETLVEDHLAIMVRTEEDLIDEIVDLELDPHSAFVSHINSPSEFWVQEEKSVGDLEVMSDRFIVADMFPKVDDVKEGLLCVAKFPEDEQWYRARVVSHSDEGTQVIYIDYGNSAVSTEIRAIPADLADIPPLSRKCNLAMPEGITEWSETACLEFIKLAADGATIFLLDVLKEDESSEVRLLLDNKDVADLLSEYCERYLPIIEERLPPLGEENSPNVFISHINSPDEFWIQTESSIADLEVMAERLQEAPTFMSLNTFETGTTCAAKYPQDDRWYRAKILSHSESETEVLYIDYGNSASTTEIRILPEDIINIVALSKCCSLQKPAGISSWSVKACKMFEELAATGATMFQFEILDDDDPMHIKLTLDGKDVVDMLTPHCDTSYNESVIMEQEENKCKQSIMVKNLTEMGSEILANQSEEIESENWKDFDNNEQDVGSEVTIAEDMLHVVQQETDKNEETIKSGEPEEIEESSNIVELTVDEIIQNMERHVMDGEEEDVQLKTNIDIESNTVEANQDNEIETEMKSGAEHSETENAEICALTPSIGDGDTTVETFIPSVDVKDVDSQEPVLPLSGEKENSDNLKSENYTEACALNSNPSEADTNVDPCKLITDMQNVSIQESEVTLSDDERKDADITKAVIEAKTCIVEPKIPETDNEDKVCESEKNIRNEEKDADASTLNPSICEAVTKMEVCELVEDVQNVCTEESAAALSEDEKKDVVITQEVMEVKTCTVEQVTAKTDNEDEICKPETEKENVNVDDLKISTSSTTNEEVSSNTTDKKNGPPPKDEDIATNLSNNNTKDLPEPKDGSKVSE